MVSTKLKICSRNSRLREGVLFMAGGIGTERNQEEWVGKF